MPALKIDLASLPPLPEFKSGSIREQVFTHRSFHARPNHLFEDPAEDPSPDNEKLEFLGDTVISLVVTALLNELFPTLRVGKASIARAMIIGNATLAEISVAYKLPEQSKFHPAQRISLLRSTSAQADVFESFVGGLYVDQGMDIVQPWLRELVRPLCYQAYDNTKGQHELIRQSSRPSAGETTTATIGYLALFNETLHKTGRTVEWVYSPVSIDELTSDSCPIAEGTDNLQDANVDGSPSPTSSSDSASVLDRERILDGLKTTPLWSVTVKVDGESFGGGRGVTKRLARNEAAKVGLKKLGINVEDPAGS